MITDKTPIYRYVSFDRFSKMVYDKKLAVISPKKWPDGYERYWLKWLDSESGKQRLRDWLTADGVDIDQAFETVNQICRYLGKMTYCLCFSEEKDAEVLWNAHSDNNHCVMFATTEEKLRNNLPDPFDCTVKPIFYDFDSSTHFTRFLSQIYIIDGKPSLWDIDELFLHKRPCFLYEKEVRLICRVDEPSDNGVIEFDIPYLNELIDGVMVHPAAEEYYVSLVKLMCEQHDIPFWGKSELYTLKL